MLTMRTKIIATASIGGHWKQLLRITRPMEERYEIVYASTHAGCATMVGKNRFYLMTDFNRNNAWRIVDSFLRAMRMMCKERPAAVITTGAAPGLVCLMAAWLMRCKTIWIDSIANAERLSASGRMARRFASRVYTQWPDLAQGGVCYAGTVMGREQKN